MQRTSSKTNLKSYEIIARSNQIARAADAVQTQLIRILGRGNIAHLRIGCTDTPLTDKPVLRRGYTIHALYRAPSPSVSAAVTERVNAWVAACHANRVDDSVDPPLAAGSTHVYVAVR